MDAKIYKPLVNKNGISDPVVIGTDAGEMVVAWWDANTKTWNTTDGQNFGGGVDWWSEVQDIPHDWHYDESLYGGLV